MKLSGMYRFTIAALPTASALLFAAACKNDPQPTTTTSTTSSAATPSASPAPASPGAPANPHAAGALPPGAMPSNAHGTAPMAAQMAPRTLDKRADGRSVLGPLSLVVPTSWTEKPSTSGMRAAQFQLPAAEGEEAELVVYYSGETGAGSVQANVDRWVSQFKQADGKPSTAKVEKVTFAGQESSLVSVSGRYVAPAMPGGVPSDKPDQSLVAAIVPSSKGPYYFRLMGSKAAVAAQEAQYREALASLKVD